MHPAFESLRSYAEYKGWDWNDDLTMLAEDISEYEGLRPIELLEFEEVFAALLFHNQVWAGFKVYGISKRFWPINVWGRWVSWYHIYTNRYGLLEVRS